MTFSAPPFPTLGIKVSFLNTFVEEFGGNEFFKGKATTEINEMVVKPEMLVHGSISFCEYMETHERFRSSVGVATVFISHAWKYQFLDVTSAIQNNFDAETVVWFDLMSNNQTIAQDLDYTWWSTTFYDAIKLIGHVAMVLAPWGRPIPFTRGWCIYEIYCAIKTNSKFEVCLPSQQIEHLLKTITTKTVFFGKILHDIDVSKSECFNPIDLSNILNSVEQMEGGVERANRVVKDTLLSWLHHKINDFARNLSHNRLQEVQRLFAYDSFLKDSGLDGAAQLYEEALAVDVNEYIDDVPDPCTMHARLVRACCFYELGVIEFSRSSDSTGATGSAELNYSKSVEYLHQAISEITLWGGSSVPYLLKLYYTKLIEVHKLAGNSGEVAIYEGYLNEIEQHENKV